MMSSLPSVNQAYAMIISDKSQKVVSTSSAAMSNKASILRTTTPKRVCLPNEDVFQDLFNSQVKEIGKEFEGLYLLVNHPNEHATKELGLSTQ
ncbi:hypothetical protein HAX54_012920 [Datura stramonium]|uniref:Uncharacterized protein n=1 Tax=Datura stramonium TaxID=4076 RepID=A0ABS8TKJ6_DATST|nr:hypothetical protein [Datura stramonium]